MNKSDDLYKYDLKSVEKIDQTTFKSNADVDLFVDLDSEWHVSKIYACLYSRLSGILRNRNKYDFAKFLKFLPILILVSDPIIKNYKFVIKDPLSLMNIKLS